MLIRSGEIARLQIRDIVPRLTDEEAGEEVVIEPRPSGGFTLRYAGKTIVLEGGRVSQHGEREGLPAAEEVPTYGTYAHLQSLGRGRSKH